MPILDQLLAPATRTWLLVAHASATLLMTGIIWFVQVVHYPLFAHVGAEMYVQHQQQHMRRTTWIVAAPMLLELTLAVTLLLFVRGPLAYLALFLLAVIWLSTWLWQVPAHAQLSSGFDAAAHRRLVRSNWVRTAGWSVRSVFATGLLLEPR